MRPPVLQNLSTTPNLNGLTVRQFLGDASQCFGGGSCIDNIIALEGVTEGLNASFSGGIPGTHAGNINGFIFSAQTNLAPPASAVPEPSSLLLLASGLAGLGVLRRRFLHT